MPCLLATMVSQVISQVISQDYNLATQTRPRAEGWGLRAEPEEWPPCFCITTEEMHKLQVAKLLAYTVVGFWRWLWRYALYSSLVWLMQRPECCEWFQSGEGAWRWLSCPSGVAVADWQNSPNQVSGRQPNPICCLAVVCKFEAGSKTLFR